MKILAVKRHTFEVKLKSRIHICTHTITEEKAGRKQIKQCHNECFVLREEAELLIFK